MTKVDKIQRYLYRVNTDVKVISTECPRVPR